ncbi:hypothetical protein MBLNU230_g4131t1 [Neophaeotheca triangularis]
MAKIPTESLTYTSGDTSQLPDLRLLHYNDVYHVEAGSREPVGGVARFQTLCNYYREDSKFAGQPELLTLFSGDAFNPSLESSVTKGSHMVPVLNNVNTNAACLGNHDLDFGVEQFNTLAARCNFPWLVANVLDPALGDIVPLGNCKRTHILQASNGIKVGLIGLVEREWLDTINSLPPNLKYLSASATAKELAPQLREQGADIVIALTHQREPNDNKLASKIPPGTLDLILGGHDHYYNHSIINNTHILRSGSDFKQLSYIELRRDTILQTWNLHILRLDTTTLIPPDPSTLSLITSLTTHLTTKLSKPIAYTHAPLDARFTTVRTRESNLGNLITDIMRLHYGAELCIIAAGTIRGDQIYPPGLLRLKDILNCFPFEDPCVVIALKGREILTALENSVSKVPALEGRFPQVSGLRFSFSPHQVPGSRVSGVWVGGRPLELEREYTLVTREYMVRGKDGFESLRLVGDGEGTARSVVGEENGLLISMLLRQYFLSLKVLGRWGVRGRERERDGVGKGRGAEGEGGGNARLGHVWAGVQEELHEVHPVREPVADTSSGSGGGAGGEQAQTPFAPNEPHIPGSDGSGSGDGERELQLMRKVMRKWWRLAGLKGHPRMCEELAGGEFGVDWTRGIAPRVEGRILCL